MQVKCSKRVKGTTRESNLRPSGYKVTAPYPL
uniref:Uncharacterized protein n=1 Tax=Anguilla anguilla TaxID=7936 RepID=A0A0E9QQ74_ANGAN